MNFHAVHLAGFNAVVVTYLFCMHGLQAMLIQMPAAADLLKLSWHGPWVQGVADAGCSIEGHDNAWRQKGDLMFRCMYDLDGDISSEATSAGNIRSADQVHGNSLTEAQWRLPCMHDQLHLHLNLCKAGSTPDPSRS